MLVGLALAWVVASPGASTLPPPRLRYGPALRAPEAEAWRAFRRQQSRWRGLFDERTGTPRALWGPPIPMRTQSVASLHADLGAWLDDHRRLLGLTPRGWRLRSTVYHSERDTWYVDYETLRENHRVEGKGLSARIRGGGLVFIHVTTDPGAKVSGDWRMAPESAREAVARREEGIWASGAQVRTSPILVPVTSSSGVSLRRMWRVTRGPRPTGNGSSGLVDATTGEVFRLSDGTQSLQGSVRGLHHPRTVADLPVEAPVPFVSVWSETERVEADHLGRFTAAPSRTYATKLRGRYLEVRNLDGPDAQLEAMHPELLWGEGSAIPAELDLYVALHQVRAWGKGLAPDVPILEETVRAEVNAADPCRAYYHRGTSILSFGRGGGGCHNTAQIADVVYHEWAHSFHASSLLAGDIDLSLAEGAADTVVFLQTGDPVIAPFFFVNGAPLRRVDGGLEYPRDYRDASEYSHENGLIFAGVMWDLLAALEALEGPEAGRAALEQILIGILRGGTDIPGSWGEALVADDDDGDLGNGTPHLCLLYESFGARGLGPTAGRRLGRLDHPPLSELPAHTVGEVQVDLVDLQPECSAGEFAEAELIYRVVGGPWRHAPLHAEGRRAVGELPGFAEGTFVEYFLRAETTEGRVYMSPGSGPVAPYTLVVGDTLEVGCEGFEADDGNYTPEGEWEWGPPMGATHDPVRAFEGARLWGTNLNARGAYGSNTQSTLGSPPISTRHYADVYLAYHRWLTVEDGTYDRATIRANGREVWANPAGSGKDHHLDGSWMAHTVDLEGALLEGEVRLQWTLDSDSGVEFGGWAIDEVCLRAPATPGNRLGISDFRITRERSRIRLSWTNPSHAPLQAIRVVSTTMGFPRGPDDGEVVFATEAPQLGAPMEVRAPGPPGANGFYAVYAFDGDRWLPWTVEGMNAVELQPPGALSGCTGLGSSNSNPWWPSLVVVLVLQIRRRRRGFPSTRKGSRVSASACV